MPAVKLAVPPLSVVVPARLPSLRNCTWPVAPEGATAAVSVTGWVVVTVVAAAESVVVVLVLVAGLTTCVTELEVTAA